MRLRIGIAVVVVLVLLGAGVAITLIVKLRTEQDRQYCKNNLRELSFFAQASDPKKETPPELLRSIPTGTIFVPEFAVDDRLSWVVLTLPNLNQHRQETTPILKQINLTKRWNNDANIAQAKVSIITLQCPGKPYVFDPNGWATTQYVGAGGIGDNAASLPVGDPQAGAFRFDQATPFQAITDGLGTTFLFGELAENRGTWLQGGPTTIRTLDVSEKAKPVIGPSGQFGGNHVNGAFFAYCDYSVRFMTQNVDPRVVQNHMTIAGGTNDPTLGE